MKALVLLNTLVLGPLTSLLSVQHQEKLDLKVLCKENPLLPEAAEHPEESEDLPGAACRAAVSSRR